MVKADFPTEFPTLLEKRFLGQATLVDLGLWLDVSIFRQIECNCQEKSLFVNDGVVLSGLISWQPHTSPSCLCEQMVPGRSRTREEQPGREYANVRDRVASHIPGQIDSGGQVAEEFFESNPRFMPTHVADPDPAANETFWVKMEEVITADSPR